MTTTVYTIGHSNHTVEAFIGLLKAHGISALADVRSSPYSGYAVQFNREPLATALKRGGIEYVFLGKELGARSEDRRCYVGGKVNFELVRDSALFRSGIKRVMDGAAKWRVAMMCAEKDPIECHRTILVAAALHEPGVDIQHILADGTLESHDAAMSRLLDELRMPRLDLFRSREQLVTDALRKRGEKIAYEEEAGERAIA